ncbi:MAG TPA: glycosyltransferase, partial [Armatimonadota bacterium]|nr:glycosyltransferase [Armatimonadota bacterium]
MAESLQNSASSHPLRVLFVSTYVPRECGIATYTEDVLHAVEGHGVSCEVIAMERPGESLAYEPRVLQTIHEDNANEYLQTAESINYGWFDVISLQHEFGIYGGEESTHLLEFLDKVELPVVTTFHTILRSPSERIKFLQHEIAERSARIVVMNGFAPDILHDIYNIDRKKIHIIHHGSPVPPFPRFPSVKSQLGLADHKVLSTFGLISPAKGLEYSIRSMPRILEVCPDAVYYILGQTHPVVRETDGESYRGELENLAYNLGILDHVRFVDRYLTKDELMKFLLATDVYVTPYLDLDQVTSGTLAYAIGMGCPV